MDERIERYLESTLTASEKQDFEHALHTDPTLSEDLAFYIKAKLALRDASRRSELSRKHQEWESLGSASERGMFESNWLAIAAVFVLVLGLLLFFNPFHQSPEDRARRYVSKDLKILPLQLSSTTDTLQLALAKYNQGNYDDAIRMALPLLQKNQNDVEALEVIGLASLQKQDYEKALHYFRRISIQKTLYTNPGHFYEALTFLNRNVKTDKVRAIELLRDIVRNDEAGKAAALKLLNEKPD
ncbi:tetratricopeptide repeat protein [Pedobacter sp. SAFR-022]|uniref:tetratricopeptide repeat protein n=1 Tax=Pedobacter sp. SAFR-022 TaxID=3436861 RepID=UPI003F81D26F